MSARWITKSLGTAPARTAQRQLNVELLDVRDLVDRAGNSAAYVRDKIATGVAVLRAGKRLIVCCDYGISRSNAIAAGILAQLNGWTVDSAAREVIIATGEAEIKIEVLNIVRDVVDGTISEEKSERTVNDRILVTGGNGFLGSAVLSRLHDQGLDALAPTRAELDLLAGRAQLDMLIRREGITRVLHLANPRVYTSNLALGDTLVMLRNVLETCVTNHVPLVYLSSWEVYSGYRTIHLRADESLPFNPTGPYGDTKFLCETLIRHHRTTNDLQCAVIRSSPVYGVASDRPKFIRTFIEKACRGEQITTHTYANGNPALDLLSVEDIAEAIAKVVAAKFIGDLNVGTGVLTSTRQIAEWIVKWTGMCSTVESIAIDKYAACIAMDHGRATRELGWNPTVTVENGIRQMLDALLEP